MLSCPVNGWTLFSLEGTESQLLSYLDASGDAVHYSRMMVPVRPV